MTIQNQRGLEGEDLAVNYLKNKGYDILERNFRSGKSEIDIIVSLNNLLVFVEVKTRTSTRFGNPEEFVDEHKAEKIMEGADDYMFEKKWKGNIRFDIISIVLKKDKPEIKHFKDAFY